jgi:pimeloyl-ACP methyl ester carboxylesterase
VPLLHIHGTTDSLVPLKHHTAVIAQRYRALGGEIKIIEVPGQGHTLWSGYFENQELIDFIIKAAIGSKPPT